MVFEPIFRCKCKESKTNRMIFDGGSEGAYRIELCPKCYANQDTKFLLSEEIISNSKIFLSQSSDQMIQ